MSDYRVGVVVGSLRRDSFNRRLAGAIVKLAPSEFLFKQLQIGDLPLYNQDDGASPAEPVRRLKAEITESDGILLVTPEYNRSMPGVLKNAPDHASRPSGQSAWAGKPAVVIGASQGSIGTALAQPHLRNSLAYLDMPTLGQPKAFVQVKEELLDDGREYRQRGQQEIPQAWMDYYVAWMKKHGGKIESYRSQRMSPWFALAGNGSKDATFPEFRE